MGNRPQAIFGRQPHPALKLDVIDSCLYMARVIDNPVPFYFPQINGEPKTNS